jgi:hypothetical protein
MDLFINKLTEATTIKNTDYTVFDVADTTTGAFNTRKISYSSFTKQLSSDVSANVKTLIDALQANLNTTNANLANKLDKKGLTYAVSERMTGTLYIPTLCATEIAHFNNIVNVHNNFIQNVKDPVLDQDAVTKKYLNDRIAGLSIPGGGSFLSKTGDAMTAGNLTLFAEPSIDKHATTKKYVDDKITVATNAINSTTTGLNSYIPLSGGTMTSGYITAPNEDPPTNSKHLANKKYVDDQITSRTSNFITTTTVGSNYVSRSGDTMTGSLILSGAPRSNNEAATKKYVDDSNATITTNLENYSTITSSNTAYLKKTGDTMTSGDLTLFRDPTQPKHATTMQWVTGQIDSKTSTFISKTEVGTNYVSKTGDTMTGLLTLKGVAEKTGAPNNSGTVTLYLSSGCTFPITLGGNVTGFTLANVPTDSFSITLFITQAATGGPYTVNYNFTGYTVKWANGGTPSITSTSSKTDVVCFTRIGNILYGFNGGQNF